MHVCHSRRCSRFTDHDRFKVVDSNSLSNVDYSTTRSQTPKYSCHNIKVYSSHQQSAIKSIKLESRSYYYVLVAAGYRIQKQGSWRLEALGRPRCNPLLEGEKLVSWKIELSIRYTRSYHGGITVFPLTWMRLPVRLKTVPAALAPLVLLRIPPPDLNDY
jgi:hypothetical protein